MTNRDIILWMNRYDVTGRRAILWPLYKQALEILKQSPKEKHPLHATSLNNLAGLYQLEGKYAKAEPLYKQALEILKQVLGEKHPD